MNDDTLTLMLEDIWPQAGLVGPFVPVDPTLFTRLVILDQQIVQTVVGTVQVVSFILSENLSWQMGGLPFSVAIQVSDPRNPAIVHVLRGSNGYVDVDGITLVLTIDTTLLHPVGQPQGQVTITAETGLRFDADGVTLLNRHLEIDLPPSEIAQTGIVVALHDLEFAVSDGTVPDAVIALGYATSFRGIYARSGTLQILSPIRFGSNQGLTVTVTDLVVGTNGISCTVDVALTLVLQGNQFGAASTAAGTLFSPDWMVALTDVDAQIVDNVPQNFGAAGLIKLPFVDDVFAVAFGLLLEGDGSYAITGHIESRGAGAVHTPFGDVSFTQVVLDGKFVSDGEFDLSGSATGISLQLDPLQIQASTLGIQLSHTATRDELRWNLSGVTLGPLGKLDQADLVLTTVRNAGGTTTDLHIEAQISWGTIQQRVAIPSQLPQPSPSANVDVQIAWHDDSAGHRTLKLILSAELTDVSSLWSALPVAVTPEVKSASLQLEIDYTSAAAFQGASTTSTLSGSFAIAVVFRVPELLTWAQQLGVQLTTGDADGWITATFAITVTPQGATTVTASLTDPLALAIQIPGLAQPTAPIQTAITSVSFNARQSSGTGNSGPNTSGSFTLGGTFNIGAIQPPASIPIAAHLEALLQPVSVLLPTGTLTGEVDFNNQRSQLKLTCQFTQAEIDLDVFKLISNLARGLNLPSEVSNLDMSEAALDFDLSFSLTRLTVQLGDITATDNLSHASIELDVKVAIDGLSIDSAIQLSDHDLKIGVPQMLVPLRMPTLPISRADVAALATDQDWTRQLNAWENEIRTLERNPHAPGVQQKLATLKPKLAMLLALWKIREKLGDAQARTNYRHYVEFILHGIETITGLTRAASNLKLKLSDLQFTVPFSDPRGIGVQGTAGLTGFAQDDPFKKVEDLHLKAGLSADLIYFSLDTGGQPIPLPTAGGRYPGGQLTIAQFCIGYGYTKHSLALALAAELVLPPNLIQEADTSTRIGAGVRLPHDSRVAFRLDLIPVPGPIPIVPSFDLSVDLRDPGTPGIAATDVVQPYWDGLQFDIPDVVHVDFKTFAASPFFGFLPCITFNLTGDIEIGTGGTGATMVVDNLTVPLGINTQPSPTPIPFVASPAQPYFDHLACNVRLAGFEINFNIERPIPSLSPMALFEVAGLIADPTMSIDPKGALANSIRLSITDAYFVFPSFIRAMFPESKEINDRPIGVTLNLGTLIRGSQWLWEHLKECWTALQQHPGDLEAAIKQLTLTPPAVLVDVLLAALPSELRKITVSGQFAGFGAKVTIILITRDQAQLEFSRRGVAGGPTTTIGLRLGETPNAGQLANWAPNLPVPGGVRAYYPADPANNLFADPDLADFSAADLAAIPAPSTPMDGILVGAYVKVYADQRFRFLGCLFEDGSFGLVSRVDYYRLQLLVAGIPVALPLNFHGRMVLTGQQQVDGYVGSITASVLATWNVVPNVIVLTVGRNEKSATLTLRSNGTFSITGTCELDLFDGSATVDGSVDISSTHCFVDGSLSYGIGSLIDLQLTVAGRLGPGQQYILSGSGGLTILGQSLLNVSGHVSDTGVAISAQVSSGRWLVAGQTIAVSVQAQIAGSIDLSQQTSPAFAFDGSGTLKVFGLELTGDVGITAINGDIALSAGGALSWLNRDWVGGQVTLGSKGVNIIGRTNFALVLTPSNLGSVQFANLFLRVELSANLTLDPQEGMASYSVQGDWMLAAGFGNGGQIFPLASQNIPQQGGGTSLEVDLINLSGFSLLPMGSLTLPIPKITGSSDLLFGFAGIVPTIAWNGTTIPSNENLNTSNALIDVSVPTIDFNSGPTISLDLNASFLLTLVWKDSTLQLRVRNGGNDWYQALG